MELPKTKIKSEPEDHFESTDNYTEITIVKNEPFDDSLQQTEDELQNFETDLQHSEATKNSNSSKQNVKKEGRTFLQKFEPPKNIEGQSHENGLLKDSEVPIKPHKKRLDWNVVHSKQIETLLKKSKVKLNNSETLLQNHVEIKIEPFDVSLNSLQVLEVTQSGVSQKSEKIFVDVKIEKNDIDAAVEKVDGTINKESKSSEPGCSRMPSGCKGKQKAKKESTPFRCHLCPYTAMRKHYIDNHLKLLHCSDCNFFTAKQELLEKHRLTHSGDSPIPLKCPHCEYKTKIIKDFEIHLQTHHTGYVNDCVQCYNANPNALTCFQCGFKAPELAILTGHKDICDHVIKCTAKLFKCSHCDYSATKHQYAINHIYLVHISEEDTSHKCYTCGFKTSKRHDFVKHRLDCEKTQKPLEERKRLKCHLCDYTATAMRYIKNHIMTTHTANTEPFGCHKCTYRTSKKRLLTQHKLNCEKVVKLFCDHCGYVGTKKDHLANHIKSMHVRGKNYMCNDCSYSCRRKDSLYSHMLTHSRDKQYKCNLCNFSTIWRNSLKFHKTTHKGTKLLKCPQCSYTAYRKNDIKKHVLVIHRPEKTFKCAQCSYWTPRSGDFNRHMLNHKNAMNFKCDYCGFSTSLKRTLQWHILGHMDPEYKCSMCNFATIRKYVLRDHILRHQKRKLKYRFF